MTTTAIRLADRRPADQRPLLRWNETNGWMDRDGLRPPEILLALAVSEALQCWKGKKPIETITEKPLPDVKDLNEAVPEAEWESGLDGKPKPPWEHQVLVYLIDPASGGFYTYLNSTIGAHIAVDHLREKVITMRALRGARVVPVVKLSQRPMKTSFGMKSRPEFEIIELAPVGWTTAPLLPPAGAAAERPGAATRQPRKPSRSTCSRGNRRRTLASDGRR